MKWQLTRRSLSITKESVQMSDMIFIGSVRLVSLLTRWAKSFNTDAPHQTVNYLLDCWRNDNPASLSRARDLFFEFRQLGASGDTMCAIIASQIELELIGSNLLSLNWADGEGSHSNPLIDIVLR
jgi:hypothetical protein